jgi:hypothetical protein
VTELARSRRISLERAFSLSDSYHIFDEPLLNKKITKIEKIACTQKHNNAP